MRFCFLFSDIHKIKFCMCLMSNYNLFHFVWGPTKGKNLKKIFSETNCLFCCLSNRILFSKIECIVFFAGGTGYGARKKSSHIYFWFWQQKQQKQHVWSACCQNNICKMHVAQQQNATNKLSSHESEASVEI